MGVREGARAASLIRADSVIPCHYGQELGQPADIAELSRQVEFLSPGTAVVPLEPARVAFGSGARRARIGGAIKQSARFPDGYPKQPPWVA